MKYEITRTDFNGTHYVSVKEIVEADTFYVQENGSVIFAQSIGDSDEAGYYKNTHFITSVDSIRPLPDSILAGEPTEGGSG